MVQQKWAEEFDTPPPTRVTTYRLCDKFVNRHNCVYYSTENPHVTIEEQLNQSGVTVWEAFHVKESLALSFSIELLLTACILTC
jgi:hypothetical protein